MKIQTKRRFAVIAAATIVATAGVTAPASAASCVTMPRWKAVIPGETMRGAEKLMRNGGVVTSVQVWREDGRWRTYVNKRYPMCRGKYGRITYRSGIAWWKHLDPR